MQPLIVAITGSTGAIFGIRLLEALRDLGVETHLLLSKWAERTVEHETPYTVAQVRALAAVVHNVHNLGASIASGSFPTAGMAIVPCSMKTLAAIAHGYSENLIHRAADVVLKERRKLVLVPRETPLSPIHLDNMLRLAQAGAVIAPPMPAFYNHPRTVDDIVDHIVARVLDQFGLPWERARRWEGRLVRPAGPEEAAGAATEPGSTQGQCQPAAGAPDAAPPGDPSGGGALWDKFRRYLAAHQVMTLATCGPEGPWASPVFYAEDEALHLYFFSDPASRHGRNLAANPACSAAVTAQYPDWRDIQGIQLEGTVQCLEGPERDRALAVYLAKYPWAAAFLDPAGPLYEKAGAKVALYRLCPRRGAFTDNRAGFGHREWLAWP